MKSVLTLTCLIGLIGLVRVSADPLIEGRVRLDSGEPVADAQVRIFDMTDLQRGAIARATTDGTGYFALPLSVLTGRALPECFSLGQNYPNPFNPSTIIPYQLTTSSEVRLEVFNLLGQHIATLVDGERAAGFHTTTWTATDAAGRAVGAGVYIYWMTVDVESQAGRMVLIDGQAGVSAAGAVPVLPRASKGSRSDGEDAQVYGLIVSGSGLAPYMDPAFQVEAGMAPVELVVSSGLYSAGKVADDDCPLCDFFDAINEQQPVTIPDASLRAAIAAFNDAGGRSYTGAKVPVESDRVHWRNSVFSNELMRSGGGGALSAVTVQSLADIGYGVDGTRAGAYPLPHEQGRIAGSLPLMPGDDRLTGRLESTDRGFDLDVRDNRLMGHLAPYPQAEPKPLCGLHLRREPIYVVDQQGYIIP